MKQHNMSVLNNTILAYFFVICAQKCSVAIEIINFKVCGDHLFTLSHKNIFYHEYFDNYIRKHAENSRLC